MRCETHKLYPNRDDVTLTSYLIDDSPETRDGTPRGGVLICPGGGYMFCSDREGEPIALAFAAMGYHAFVLRYSVYAELGEFAFDMLQKQGPRERCFFPAPMLDIAHAFLMIEDMASANLICMNKLALCGFSAGGHNAAMYATHLEDEVLLAAVSPRLPVRPAACILGYPISDYILMSEQAEDNPITRSLFMGNAITSFGTEQPSTEQLLSASPARLVSESTPPMFLWATYEDALVPVIQTVKMASAMALKGRPFEMHIFEKGPHGLSLADYATAYCVSDINPEAREWLPMCKRWLEQRFAPPLARKGKWV